MRKMLMLPSGNVFTCPTSDIAQVEAAACEAMAANVVRFCSVLSFGVSDSLTCRAGLQQNFCMHVEDMSV